MSTTVGRLWGTEGSPPRWNRCRRNAPPKLRQHDQAENPYILFGAEPVGANHDPGIEFAPNSPLEQRGFELPVPRAVEERCRNDKCTLARWRWLVRGALPCPLRSRWDWEFESPLLQQTVRLSPASAVERREPRLSARVCAAGFATGSAETRRVFRYRANRRQYLCRARFQYVQSPSHYGWKSRHIGEWACDVSLAGDRGFDPASSSGASGAKPNSSPALGPHSMQRHRCRSRRGAYYAPEP